MTSWWNTKWNNDNICGITHTRLRPGKNKNGLPYTIRLKCSHRFYMNPLLHWLERSSTCPCCRRSISLQDLLDVI